MALLQFDQVTFRWPDGVGLHDVSFAVNPGDFVLLSGPSGAGKSTLLRLMVRFEEPQSGTIRYNGEPFQNMAPTVLRRTVVLLQQSPVMGGDTVSEALRLPFTFAAAKGTPPPDDAALTAALAEVRLEGVPLTQGAEALSLGQKQRVALARVLLLRPTVLLLDEPTSALDAESRHAVEDVVEAANARGISVVLVTHTDYQPARPFRTLHVEGGTVTEVQP